MVASEWWKAETAIAVCAAVSNKRGLIFYDTRKLSFKQDDFIDFVSKLIEHTDDISRCLLLLDNCAIHKTKRATKFL